MGVLVRIEEAQSITPGELAALTGMTRGAISKVLDKLETKGWAESRSRKTDQRVQDVTLTAAGVGRVPDLARIADENDRHFFHVLTEAEQAALRGLLDKLVHSHGLTGTPTE